MAWAIRHPEAGTSTRYRRESTTIRWPRGLALIGLCAMLVSAWGAIVPFVGPTFGYTSNGAASWTWTFQHAMLYLVPGGVGVLISLGVISRAGGGKAITRASLGLLGLVLVACGAWFVIGPAAWPMLHGGRVFGAGTTPTASFVNQIGYNLGIGVLLAAFGGMVMKAMTGEREIRTAATAQAAPRATAADTAPATREVPAAGTATREVPAAGEAPADATREVRPVSGATPGAAGGPGGSLVDAPSEEATREVPRSEGA